MSIVTILETKFYQDFKDFILQEKALEETIKSFGLSIKPEELDANKPDEIYEDVVEPILKEKRISDYEAISKIIYDHWTGYYLIRAGHRTTKKGETQNGFFVEKLNIPGQTGA